MKFFPPVFAVVRIMKCDVYEMGRDMETFADCVTLTKPSQVIRHSCRRATHNLGALLSDVKGGRCIPSKLSDVSNGGHIF